MIIIKKKIQERLHEKDETDKSLLRLLNKKARIDTNT